MSIEHVVYADSSVIPADYKCADCGVTGCKLWRQFNTMNPKQLCAACTCKDQDKVDSVDAHGRIEHSGSVRTDQIGWYVPCVPTEDGRGYQSHVAVSLAGINWWRSLPTRPATTVRIVGIKSGPCKYDFMLALFEHSSANPRRVAFILQSTDQSNWWVEGMKLSLHITEVGIEDGSGQSWRFRGKADDGINYMGWYRTDTNKGTIEVETPSQETLDAHERMGTRRVLEDLGNKYQK